MRFSWNDYVHTVMILYIWTGLCKQCRPRSVQGLHCLLFCLHVLTHYHNGRSKSNCSNFRIITSKCLGVRFFVSFIWYAGWLVLLILVSCRKIRIFNGCEVQIENSITRVTVRHEACWVMPNSYPERWNFQLALNNHYQFFFWHTFHISFDNCI